MHVDDGRVVVEMPDGFSIGTPEDKPPSKPVDIWPPSLSGPISEGGHTESGHINPASTEATQIPVTASSSHGSQSAGDQSAGDLQLRVVPAEQSKS